MSGLPQLAPDLTYPKDKVGPTALTKTVAANVGSTPVTVLSVSGKCVLSSLSLGGLSTTGTLTVELVIDGMTIWNTSFANTSAVLHLLDSISYQVPGDFNGYTVSSTLTLRLTQSVSSDAYCTFLVRPIK